MKKTETLNESESEAQERFIKIINKTKQWLENKKF